MTTVLIAHLGLINLYGICTCWPTVYIPVHWTKMCPKMYRTRGCAAQRTCNDPWWVIAPLSCSLQKTQKQEEKYIFSTKGQIKIILFRQCLNKFLQIIPNTNSVIFNINNTVHKAMKHDNWKAGKRQKLSTLIFSVCFLTPQFSLFSLFRRWQQKNIERDLKSQLH